MARWSRRELLMAGLGLSGTGCHLVRFSSSQSPETPSVGDALKATKPDGHPLDGPRRVGLKIATLSSTLQDPAIDQAIWRTTDEQVVPKELRDLLRNNGLRIGLLRSSLPAEVDELMEHGGHAGQKVEPLVVNQPVNEPVKLATAEKTAEASLLIDAAGKVQGKSYKDLSGFIRLTTSMDDQKGVVLKVTPELHHGEIKSRIAPVGTVENPFEPAQMSLKNQQEEELFRDLAANIRLEQGQCLVIGLDSSRQGGLGWFLLTSPPETDKETQQKLILVWAWNAGREATLDIPSVVQSNSRQNKAFQPLQSPPSEMLARQSKGKGKSKRDDQIQAAGFEKSARTEKPEPRLVPQAAGEDDATSAKSGPL